MCGRAACGHGADDLQALSGARRFLDAEKREASYNIAPGQFAAVLRRCRRLSPQQTRPQVPAEKAEPQQLPQDSLANDEIVLQSMKWGLVPSYTKAGAGKSAAYKMINARSETVAEKPAFRRLLRHHRCVFLCDGFYEWKKLKNGKTQPYFIRPPVVKNGKCHFWMASLYDKWIDPASSHPLYTFTVLTTDSSKPLQEIHDRMPVLLDAEGAECWLNPERTFQECRRFLHPSRRLECFPVAPKVNQLSNRDQDCLQPLQEFIAASKARGIMRFFKPSSTKRMIKDEAQAEEQTPKKKMKRTSH